jgi:nicotinamide mononucleotide transporter
MLFFQVQLYADMFLQAYFVVVTIYGWYWWNKRVDSNMITTMGLPDRIWIGLIVIIASLVCGVVIKDIHLYLPQYFKIQAAYPFTDSFIMISSIVATVLLAKKKIENWYLWISIDVAATFLYFKKGIYFLSLEYLIFFGLASYGLYHWRKELRRD